MLTDRKSLLKSVITYDSFFADSLSTLNKFKWDSPGIVVLNTIDVISILRRFLANELSGKQVEEWANAIESREDIDYKDEDKIKEVIFDLANPSITYPLSFSKAKEIIASLGE